MAEIPSRKPHKIGQNLSLLFPQLSLHPSAPGNAVLLCFTEKSRTYQKRDLLKSATRPEEPLPVPNLPSYSSGGGIQGLSKATPFRFQPSLGYLIHQSPLLLPNTDPTSLPSPCHLAFKTCSSLLPLTKQSLLWLCSLLQLTPPLPSSLPLAPTRPPPSLAVMGHGQLPSLS